MFKNPSEISARGDNKEFVVPSNFFQSQREICLSVLSAEEFGLPTEFFESSKLSLRDTLGLNSAVENSHLSNAHNWGRPKRANSTRKILLTSFSVAALWLVGLVIFDSNDPSEKGFDDLLAETEIWPEDILVNATDDDLYLAYAILVDTLCDDSTSHIQMKEKLDPKTGLPIYKSKELDDIEWDHITPADAIEYFEEFELEDDSYN